MSSVPPKSYFPGETIRVWASDLTHLDHGPITEGATVTISIVDKAGDETGISGTAVATNDDWSVDLTMPGEPGNYRLVATAVAEGATWKGLMSPLRVVRHE